MKLLFAVVADVDGLIGAAKDEWLAAPLAGQDVSDVIRIVRHIC